MSANGMMIVWSGLLLRSRNEAELASVLGHEFAHFERRHGLSGFRRARTASDIIAWATVLSALAAQPNYTNILTIGALYEFNRNQEREADVLGLAYLKRSRYRPQSAAQVWIRQMGEVDASAVGRAQRSQRYDRTPYFATHPTDLERAGYLTGLAGPEAADRITNAEAYAAAMGPWLAGFLDDQIRLNDFGGTEFLLAQMADARGWTAELLHARGELYRSRGHPRDLVNAADFYRQAVALDPARADAHRGLGLALMRARNVEEGRAALTRYISMRPDASDAPMIRALIDQPL
jgi:predicted Zn-dependent protease